MGEGRNVAPGARADKGHEQESASRKAVPRGAVHRRVAGARRRPVDFRGSLSSGPPHFGSRAGHPREEAIREAPVPAEHPQAQEDARLPGPHAHSRWAGRRQGPAPPAPVAALGLIRRVRDRATFEALARADRRRRGSVTLRFVAGAGDTPARVALATDRSVAGAVARNRVRRRLRAAVAVHADELDPGAAYLFGAGREALTVPFPELARAVVELARSARPEQP
jgi:ribonuclease P protein component